jgi:cysteine synthase
MNYLETPLLRVKSNLFVKAELFNPAGSHKARSARYVVEDALARGYLTPGGRRRILEKTGGNFGIGLAMAARPHSIGVDLVVGLSFSPIKRAMCEAYGARLVGVDRLEAGLSPKEVIAELLSEDPTAWHFTDQFANAANLTAHERETGPEIVSQLHAAGIDRSRPLILVKGAGTGASTTGVARCLKLAFSKVQVTVVVPLGCDLMEGVFVDHPLEGIAVGVRPPFLDYALVDQFTSVSPQQALEGQTLLARAAGIFPGSSSGASVFVASALAQRLPEATIVTFAYDGGEYSLLRNLP